MSSEARVDEKTWVKLDAPCVLCALAGMAHTSNEEFLRLGVVVKFAFTRLRG